MSENNLKIDRTLYILLHVFTLVMFTDSQQKITHMKCMVGTYLSKGYDLEH